VSLERLEIVPFAMIVGEVLRDRQTGDLTLIRRGQRRVLYFSQGELVMIASDLIEESLANFLVRRGAIPSEVAPQLLPETLTDVAARFHESGLLDLSTRQTLLRDWLASVFIPIFSLDEGTSVLTENSALDPEKRVFLQSTAALTLEGIRSITNGLVLRRSLGDLKREIGPAQNSRFKLETTPLTENERRIATSLTAPQTVESFLKQFSTDSVTAAKVVIGMLTLGIFETFVAKPQAPVSFDDMQRDLELLAAIGSSDQRSLRAVAMSRQLASVDHYQLLGIPRAASRAQILTSAEEARKRYDPTTFPQVVRDAVLAIYRRIDEALNVLKDAGRRATYDKLLNQAGMGGDSIRQRVSQQTIAEQNLNRARELAAAGDYYSAILLLKQSVEFAPDNSQAWFLLGSCQERNPNWRREATESFQMALSINPEFVEAMISLGDLYKLEGMISRAQSLFEDVLKISADNPLAKSRLAGLKKK
jgi:tetratricopeptide (TPR) repeat protein